MSKDAILRIATGGSPSPWAGAIAAIPVGTPGDLFMTEIGAGLLAGTIGFAVHSMRGMRTWLPDRLEIPHLLPRDDRRQSRP